ncbi:MAG: fluoride efflux transporter CrcB [Frankiaceae bacterium]
MLALLIAVAAGLGAIARYVLDQVVQHRTRAVLPYGTLLVNVTGSFLLGLVTGLAAHHGLPRTPTLVIGTGFAGGYTTLSTWAWETVALAEGGDLPRAGANVALSIVAGLAAAAAGLSLALL